MVHLEIASTSDHPAIAFRPDLNKPEFSPWRRNSTHRAPPTSRSRPLAPRWVLASAFLFCGGPCLITVSRRFSPGIFFNFISLSLRRGACSAKREERTANYPMSSQSAMYCRSRKHPSIFGRGPRHTMECMAAVLDATIGSRSGQADGEAVSYDGGLMLAPQFQRNHPFAVIDVAKSPSDTQGSFKACAAVFS